MRRPSVPELKEPWHLEKHLLFLLWMSALKTFPNFFLRHVFPESATCAGCYLKGCSRVIWASSMNTRKVTLVKRQFTTNQKDTFYPPVWVDKWWTADVCFIQDNSVVQVRTFVTMSMVYLYKDLRTTSYDYGSIIVCFSGGEELRSISYEHQYAVNDYQNNNDY